MKKLLLFAVFTAFISSLFAQYCPLTGDCGNGYIVEVNFNGISNTSACDDNGYSDYTSTVDFGATPGSVVELFVRWDAYYGERVYVWIDWDNSGSWENESEYYTIGTTNPPNPEGMIPISVPATANLGDVVRMRLVRVGIDAAADPCDGGVVFFHGEVEDYNISITDNPPSSSDYCDARGYSYNHPDSCLRDEQAAQFNMWLGKFGFDNQDSNTSSCGLDNGYSDYTNDFLFTGIPGEIISGIGETMPYAGSATHDISMWVDWNQDSTFSPDEEVPFVVNNDNATSGVSGFTFNFTVPPTAVAGITRLRVRAYTHSVLDYIPAPCGSTIRGEVEDYLIEIGESIECAVHKTPTDNQQNLCTNNITLTWSPPASGPASTGYKVFMGTDNPPNTLVNGQDVGLDTTYTYPSTLPANTKYYWQIIAYDANGDASGCNVDSFTTAMNPDPSIDQFLIGGVDNIDSTAVCAESNLTLQAITSGGTGVVDFSWTGDDAPVDDVASDNTFFNASNTGTYKLRFTIIDDNLCRDQDSVKIYVKPLPDTGTLSADKADVCPGEEVKITLNGNNGTIDDWEKKEGANPYASVNHTNNELTTTISVDTDFKVLLSNSEGCTAESNSVTVTLKPAPNAPTISVAPNNTACEGDTIELTSSEATSIVWSDANNSTTQTIKVYESGNFRVTYTDPTTGCSATSTDETITFNDRPDAPTVIQSGDSLITDPIMEVNWIDANGDVVHVGESYSPDRTPGQSFTATITDSGTGCESEESEELAYDHTVSIRTIGANAINMSVYPNPVKNDVTIVLENNQDIQVIDVSGRIIIEQQLTKGKNTVSLSELNTGSYFIRYQNTVIPIIKE